LPQAEVRVRVTPRSSSERVQVAEGALRAWVHAPPAEGEANDALLSLLAKKLGIPKLRLSIGRGGKSRDKTVVVSGITGEELEKLIKERIG
jgi:uncharacterized protein YggU (UPF0235/DUF167 family)